MSYWQFLIAATLAASPLCSQDVEGRGQGAYDGLPIVLSTSDATPPAGSGANGADLMRKGAGVHGPGALPSFGRMGAIHDSIGLDSASLFPGVASPPDIDAMSFGIDWIASDAFGELLYPPGTEVEWSALVFSVTTGSNGLAGGAIAGEADDPHSAGADIFTYTVLDAAIATDEMHRAVLSQDSTEISLHSTATPGAGETVEVDALDVFATLFALDDDIPFFVDSPMTCPNELGPVLYFSISNATVGQIPASWNIPGPDQNGATIFRMEPVDLGSGFEWSLPSVHLSAADLGVTANEDVDALAFDCWQNFVLFSTVHAKGSSLDQLLFKDLNDTSTPTPPPTPLGAPLGGGTALSEIIIDAFPDDIDAICAIDPRNITSLCTGTITDDDVCTTGPTYDRTYLIERMMGLPDVKPTAAVTSYASTPASVKMFVEEGPFLRVILRDAVGSEIPILFASTEEFPSFFQWEPEGLLLLSPFVAGAFDFPFSPGQALQQVQYPYPATVLLTPLRVQVAGVNLDGPYATFNYTSETLTMAVGIPAP